MAARVDGLGVPMTRVRLDTASRMLLEPIRVDLDETPRPAPLVPSRYVELTVRSNFSFLQGASSPEALVQRAAELGYDALAVTDLDGLYGIVRAHEEARKQGVRLVVGCELTFSRDGTMGPFSTLTVHVESHEGYSNLCRILTRSHGLHEKGKVRDPKLGLPKNCFAGVALDDVCAWSSGLWVLAPSGSSGETLGKLKDAFGPRASLAVHRHLVGDDRARTAQALASARELGLPICATNLVVYARRENKPVHDVLHCIREGVTLEEAGRALAPNTEAHLKNEAEILRLFRGREAWIARTREIADACLFKMNELKYHFPCEIDEPAFPGETPDQALRRLTYEVAKSRLPSPIPDKTIQQIEKELALIAHIDVAPYFLSVQSIVEIARSKDILCQGRGSAANSAVCFCLGITAVDPTRTNLLFERFLSAERREPPDIDVDFEHERREEVIQELYARYGRERAAMVSEVICYRGRSALREVGKVFGLSLDEVDRLSAVVNWWDGVDDIDGARLKDAGLPPDDGRVKMAIRLAKGIQGTPRHLSIHVGGFVLSAEPLERVAPIEPATMAGRTIIPWDKDDLDTLGFFKVDVLALGILTAVRKALAMIDLGKSGAGEGEAGEGEIEELSAIDQLARIPPEDPAVYEALCHADTVGVFQIESRAQMSMLPRLLPRCFYDLVVEVAIVRPGPIQGGMIHPYLRRRNGQEEAVAPHPCLEPILARTLGVPLFQEQVMQIAIVGAGYTGGEADMLRRDMAAWKKTGKLERHRARLYQGFAERGISAEFSEKLFLQIQGFGEYGFPESHAASFALLVYSSSWLKVHHPAAFAAALVNSQPMGFYSPSTILQDAQKHGVTVLPIDVLRSDWDCTLEEDVHREGGSTGENQMHSPDLPSSLFKSPSLRVGLRQVRGLGKEAGLRIETARALGPFASVEDLVLRAALNKRELDLLAEAGSLASLVPKRREAIWKVRVPRGPGRIASRQQTWLFVGMELEEPEARLAPLSRAEELALDYETTGLSVHDHPMRLMRPTLPRHVKSGAELMTLAQGTRTSAAGLVICRQRPMTASGVVFITMEDETGFLNLILYAHVFEQNYHVATTSTLLLAHGAVEREGEVVYVVVKRLEGLRLHESVDRLSMSRDFH